MKKGGFFLCGTSIDDLFTDEVMRGNFVFWVKMSPLFLARCCLRGVLFFLFRVDRMMGAEGSDGKTSPPFLASIFRFFRGYFWFGPFERSEPPLHLFGIFCAFCAEGFLVRAF